MLNRGNKLKFLTSAVEHRFEFGQKLAYSIQAANTKGTPDE